MKRKFLMTFMTLLVATSLTGCSFVDNLKEKLPFLNGSSEQVEEPVDNIVSAEMILEGQVYNVGDVISVTDIVVPDPTKVVLDTQFMEVSGAVAPNVVCNEEGDYSITVVIQYEDGSQFSGEFVYTVVNSNPLYNITDNDKELVTNSENAEVLGLTENDGILYALTNNAGLADVANDESVSKYTFVDTFNNKVVVCLSNYSGAGDALEYYKQVISSSILPEDEELQNSSVVNEFSPEMLASIENSISYEEIKIGGLKSNYTDYLSSMIDSYNVVKLSITLPDGSLQSATLGIIKEVEIDDNLYMSIFVMPSSLYVKDEEGQVKVVSNVPSGYTEATTEEYGTWLSNKLESVYPTPEDATSDITIESLRRELQKSMCSVILGCPGDYDVTALQDSLMSCVVPYYEDIVEEPVVPEESMSNDDISDTSDNTEEVKSDGEKPDEVVSVNKTHAEKYPSLFSYEFKKSKVLDMWNWDYENGEVGTKYENVGDSDTQSTSYSDYVSIPDSAGNQYAFYPNDYVYTQQVFSNEILYSYRNTSINSTIRVYAATSSTVDGISSWNYDTDMYTNFKIDKYDAQQNYSVGSLQLYNATATIKDSGVEVTIPICGVLQLSNGYYIVITTNYNDVVPVQDGSIESAIRKLCADARLITE